MALGCKASIVAFEEEEEEEAEEAEEAEGQESCVDIGESARSLLQGL